jgi:hypothetical protein
MPWQIYEKTVQRSISPSITISQLGRINFNGAAAKILHDNGVESVLLMWDPESRRIGIRRIARKDSRSYTVHYARKNAWAGFAAKGFLMHIGYDYSKTTAFPAEWDKTEELFTFSLPVQTGGQEPDHAVRPERTGVRRQVEQVGRVKASNAF